MRALPWTAWAARRPTDVLAILASAVYVGIAARYVLGIGSTLESALLPLPLVFIPLVLMRTDRLPPVKSAALAAALVAFGAAYSATRIPSNPLIALAAPAIVVASLVAARWPAIVLGAVLLCTGAFGSLDVLAGVPAAKLADLLLVGLWVSAAWTWLTAPRSPALILPAVLVLGAYLVVTLLQVPLADSQDAAIQSFRGQNWYLAATILVAYAPWSPETRSRMLQAAIAVGLLVGGYATFRWIAGPAGGERELAEQYAVNFLNGELRPIGSFATPKELAAWTAIFVPFLLASAITRRDRWSIAAFAATGLCTIAMLAADVRAGPAAAVPAVIAVVALYQIAQAFRGRRGPGVLVLVMVAIVGSAAAFTWTLGDKPDTRERYTNILHPERDESYQARLVKWRTALDDIEDQPLGHGLGTAGRAQKRFGTTANIGSIDIDNSYLKVAYEQGFVIMLLLAASMIAILATLIKGGAVLLDRARAGPAIAAAGALIAMSILFWIGNYIEGLPALGGWLLVGLGLGQLTPRERAAAE